jgi:hypothetical protein
MVRIVAGNDGSAPGRRRGEDILPLKAKCPTALVGHSASASALVRRRWRNIATSSNGYA